MAATITKKEEKLIFKQMIKVMKDTEAISKERQNEQQRYKFRGIDDVYNMIHGILAKHGIVTIPTVIAEKREKLKASSGKDMIASVLKVSYRFVAEDGSSTPAIVVGEGFDFGDKATNKAMSAAHKYCLLQTFCIPTDEPKDSEEDSPEVKHNGQKAQPQQRQAQKPPPQTKSAQKPAQKAAQKPQTRRSVAEADKFEEPPPHDYANESDFVPEAKPPSKFDTAVKMTIAGQKKHISYGEALQIFQKAKKFLGDEDYYEVLGGYGFEKSDQIPFDQLDDLYKAMLAKYNEKRDAQ